MNKVNWIKLREDAILPQYATKHSVGLDIFCPEDFTLLSGEKKLVKIGLTCEFSPNIELQIRSKSGLTLKHEIVVLNSPGTIEADYAPNEIGVILKNHSKNDMHFTRGQAIAQAVFAPVVIVDFPGKLNPTVERTGGFGSTKK